MVYDKPFTHGDHDAISPNVPVVGEVSEACGLRAYDAVQEGRRS